MGGIQGGDYVSKKGISLNQILNANKTTQNEKLGKQLASIFNQYNTNATGFFNEEQQIENKDVLDEKEQAAAQQAFANMDADGDGTVTKGEYQKIDNAGFKAYESFMNYMNGFAKHTGDSKEVVITDTSGNNTPSIVGKDDKITNVPPPKTEETSQPQAQQTTPPAANPTQPDTSALGNMKQKDVQQAVYKYLFGSDKITQEIDVSENDNSSLKFTQAKDGDKNVWFVSYNNNNYRVMKNKDGNVVVVADNGTLKTEGDTSSYTPASAGTTSANDAPKTLLDAIIKQDNNDKETAHNYRNKRMAQNNQSSYDAEKGEITHTGTDKTRRHVNPAQTFASMLMNSHTDSRLSFGADGNAVLKGEDVIKVMLGTSDEAKVKAGIGLDDLIKYIKADIAESQQTNKEHQATGVRNPASDVDLDLKDMANIGQIFKQYDEDNDNKLNPDELTKLIAALKNNSTTSLATDYYKEHPENTTPPATPDEHPTVDPHQTVSGRKLEPNRTRHKEGTQKGDNNRDLTYHYENRMRTRVVDGKAVENYNFVETDDKGPFGIGRKVGIDVYGVPDNCRAKIVSGDKDKNNQVVKIEYPNGTVEYHKVNYDKTKDTYTLGKSVGNKKGSDIGGLDNADIIKGLGLSEANAQAPAGLSAKKKGNNTTYYYRGREIPRDVARARVLAYNARLRTQQTQES